MDMYAFYMGREFDAHEYLGAHRSGQGFVFRTFAPNAQRVSLLLNNEEIPMNAVYDGNFYEIFIGNASVGEKYEYRIYDINGTFCDHADPYGFGSELRPDHRSVICDLSEYKFNDNDWTAKRGDSSNRPLNIYEMHLGSWKRDENGEMLSYVEIGERLIPYMHESGYNYVEFLPLTEHPCDESWGYQSTGFFSPTSRYGTPFELMQMIDMLHLHGIGVILDFVPVHFALDDHALARYDGTPLYEYPNDAVGYSEWGSCNFMHSRGEVRSFLQSSANFWLKYYHFDGLRIDAISRIIYWQGDEKRGENGNAVDFIKVMNMGLKERHRGCLLIAEDSTNYPNVTKAVTDGGLGFDYKWDMGFMHDILEYFQAPAHMRHDLYHKLTFSMMYFGNERYLLPFSHDEVVHGKATVLQKMNGEYSDKFPQARAMYLFMAVHPGKKLNFMGNEFGQLREWDEKREQDWELRKYPAHDNFYRYMSELNRIYLTSPALYELDYDGGFSWLECNGMEKCIYSAIRKSREETLIAIFNFSDARQEYKIPAPYADMSLETLINTDWEKYGGNLKYDLKTGSTVNLSRFSGILIKVKNSEKR